MLVFDCLHVNMECTVNSQRDRLAGNEGLPYRGGAMQ